MRREILNVVVMSVVSLFGLTADAGVGQQGIGPQGIGPQGIGPQGIGPQGIGPQGIGPQGIGPQGIGPQGIGPQGIGPQGIGPQGIGPQGIGPQGIGPQGIGPQSSSFDGANFDGSNLRWGASGGVTYDGSDVIANNLAWNPDCSNCGAMPDRGVWQGMITWSDASTQTVWFRISDAHAEGPSGYKNTRPAPYNDDSDVWQYRVQVYATYYETSADNIVTTATTDWFNLCGHDVQGFEAENYGMFIQGRFTADGTYINDDSATQFACNLGTVAKSIRTFGYKPWLNYTNPEDQSVHPGAQFWITMVNAAMANYCGSGHSFTRLGTYVDVWDQFGLNVPTPKTWEDADPSQQRSFATESVWALGAYVGVGAPTGSQQGLNTKLVNSRYYDPSQVSCNLAGPVGTSGGHFVPPIGASFFDNNPTGKLMGPGDLIQIDTSTLCPHSPSITGKPLDPYCSKCVAKVCDTDPNVAGFESSCCSVSSSLTEPVTNWAASGNWGANCVAAAQQLFNAGQCPEFSTGSEIPNTAPRRVAGVAPSGWTSETIGESDNFRTFQQVFSDFGWMPGASGATGEDAQMLFFVFLGDRAYDVVHPDGSAARSTDLDYTWHEFSQLRIRPKVGACGAGAADTIYMLVLDSGTTYQPLMESFSFNIPAYNTRPYVAYYGNPAPAPALWNSSLSISEDQYRAPLMQDIAFFISAGIAEIGGADHLSYGCENQTMTYLAEVIPSTAGTLHDSHTGLDVASGSALSQSEIPYLQFTPAANWNGTATFRYTATDSGSPPQSLVLTQTINVAAVNDAPVANANTVTVKSDSTNNTIAVVATDVDSPTLTYSLTSNAAGVTLSGSTATYTPPAHWSGTTNFYFQAFDGSLYSNSAMVTINVTNTAPTFTVGNKTISEDSGSSTQSITGIADNEQSPSNIAFTITSLTPSIIPNSGFSVSGTGTSRTLSLPAPIANANGTATIQVVANDLAGGTTTKTFTLTVTAVNDPPIQIGSINSDAVDLVQGITTAYDLWVTTGGVKSSYAAGPAGENNSTDNNLMTFAITAVPTGAGIVLNGSTAVSASTSFSYNLTQITGLRVKASAFCSVSPATLTIIAKDNLGLTQSFNYPVICYAP